MADVYWPDGLPKVPLVDGYRHTAGNTVISYKMDYGPSKVRRRTSANMSIRAWTFVLNRRYRDKATGKEIDQKSLFIRFMEMNPGRAIWFPDPEREGWLILVRFVPMSDEEGYELVPESRDIWTVGLKAEVFPNAERRC